MARSVNIAIIIGNLTRDPEMRYTPAGHAVVSFGVATNRYWTTAEGERREEVEFHNIVAWNKLAEICSQYLSKGRKVYIRGRLQTRSWEAQDGAKRSRTEIVAEDMVILDSRRGGEAAPPKVDAATEVRREIKKEIKEGAKQEAKAEAKVEAKAQKAKKEDVNPKEMPF